MGRLKQSLQFRGSSLLRRAATAAVDADCHPIVVVTGANESLSRRELDGLDVRAVWNCEWETGMASSIGVGLASLTSDRDVDAAVLMLCDQPHVTAEVIAALVDAHEVSGSPVIASSYGDGFGAPALFGRALFAELAGLQGAAGAKEVIARHASDARFIAFPEGEVDVDTPEDFARLVSHGRGS